MWSVTLTDFFQMMLVAVVICLLGFVVIDALGVGNFQAGLAKLLADARIDQEIHEHRNPLRLFAYLNVFAIAALGNLPGQDLAQRIFSAKSATVAQRACLIAGACYLFFGSISILLGIAARSLLPAKVTHSVIPHLAMAVLSPMQTVLLVLAIISIIMSTMDSAMLATASIIAHNLIRPRLPEHISFIAVARVCIVLVGVSSLALALLGKSAYVLLEQSYAVSFAGLFAPFMLGLYLKNGHEKAAIVSMMVGMAMWLGSFFVDHLLLSELAAVFASLLSYGITLVLARTQLLTRRKFLA
jgi:Na+/proline symporter